METSWYIAEMLEEFRATGEDTSLLNVNWILIQARDAEEAYVLALQLGEELNQKYINPDGKEITIRFRGLRDLNVIHEELEHGAEIVYEEYDDISDPQINAMVADKNSLSVFQPPKYKSEE